MTDRRRASSLRSVPAGYQYGDAARAEPVVEAVAGAPVVGICEHYTAAAYFDVAERQKALAKASEIAGHLVAELRAQGYTKFWPLPMLATGYEVCVVREGCRVLVAWIPDWSGHEHAGDWCCRADTLASGKAEV